MASNQTRGNPDVIIVVPPFADPSMPALGPSLLLAGCLKRKINCRIFYANLIFAAMIGHDLYHKILFDFINCDAFFAPYVFNVDKNILMNLLLDNEYYNLIFDQSYEVLSLQQYTSCDNMIANFLDNIVKEILNYNPSIIGFSSLSNQNTSSLAIAKRVKEISPEIISVIGGSNVSHPMGKALLDIAPMIDYAFSGEADLEFSLFCNNFLNSKSLPSSKIVNCAPITDLDQAEIPNYDDYFKQLTKLQNDDLLPLTWPDCLPFESSRGCWKASKSPCAFCGLNINNLTYRKKSKERIIKEIVHLKDCYGINIFLATDTIMPKKYDIVLNDIINMGLRLTFFYEIRSNISPVFLDKFVKAGVVILQPGIESLSTNVLKKMEKGINALQNLKLLREAGSRQISLIWNFLLGAPGETQEDYEKILEILPMLEHFQPPTGFGPVRIDRYSPYFNNPSKYGIKRLRPLNSYNIIYPLGTNLYDIAYIFIGDYDTILSMNYKLFSDLKGQFIRWINMWNDIKKRPTLSKIKVLYGISMIRDTRAISRQTFTALDDESFELLEILNEPTREESIPEALRPYLPELLERKFVLFYEDRYISLVTDSQIGINLRKQKQLDHPSTTQSL